MNTATVKKINEHIVETAQDAARLRDTVVHAIGDGVDDARRVARRSLHIAEDMIADAETTVRHHPLSMVGVAALGTFAIGGLAGFLLGRKR